MSAEQVRKLNNARQISAYLTLIMNLRSGRETAQIEVAGKLYDLTAAIAIHPILEILVPLITMQELLNVCASLVGAPVKTAVGKFHLHVHQVKQTPLPQISTEPADTITHDLEIKEPANETDEQK
jgi:hypothetical protein